MLDRSSPGHEQGSIPNQRQRALPEHRTAQLQRLHFRQGEVIIHQGELGDRFYLLESGEVEILREEPGQPEQQLAIRRAGEFFGEIALLQDVPRTATVRCLTPVDVVSLTRQDFRLLVDSSPTFRAQFTQGLPPASVPS